MRRHIAAQYVWQSQGSARVLRMAMGLCAWALFVTKGSGSERPVMCGDGTLMSPTPPPLRS